MGPLIKQRLNARSLLVWDPKSSRLITETTTPPEKPAARRLLSVVLPENYPRSVRSPHYHRHSLFTWLEGFAGSIVGVFATQAMLSAMLTSPETGKLTLLSESSLPYAAATVNWVLKDGLGQLGGIGFVAMMGRRFDLHPQQLRMMSGLLLKAAVALELCTPFVPRYFLPLAAIATACMNVSWMACSASRAPILKTMSTGGGNLGELMGKAASQLTIASMLGMGVGMAVSEALRVHALSGALTNLYVCTPLMAFGTVALWRSCRWAVSDRLHPRRIERIVHAYMATGKTPTPEEVSATESLFSFSKQLRNIILDAVLCKVDESAFREQLAKRPYVVLCKDNSVYVWLCEGATDKDAFAAIVEAVLLRDGAPSTHENSIISGCEGWDTSSLGSIFKRRIVS